MRHLKSYLGDLYVKAVLLNHENIRQCLEPVPGGFYVDLGCDDGSLTRSWAKAASAQKIGGVECVPERARLAEQKGVQVIGGDLNERIDFPSDSIDVITCNQVIEHLYDSDRFLAELFRILKPGGIAVISTENASSWCNIFAGLLGWQIFSLTNFSSKKLGLGNPLALHREEQVRDPAWLHVRVYNIRGLKEYFEAFRFQIEDVKGAGYFPLAGRIGRWDVTHSHFITFKIRKPL